MIIIFERIEYHILKCSAISLSLSLSLSLTTNTNNLLFINSHPFISEKYKQKMQDDESQKEKANGNWFNPQVRVYEEHELIEISPLNEFP